MTERTPAELEGKVVLITGAGSGIGRGAAERFAEEGARVAAADIRAEAAHATADLVGPSALAVQMDVRSHPSVAGAIEQVVDAFGGINILVNNAGLIISGTVDSLTPEEWELQLDTNLGGVYAVSRAVYPVFKRQGSGCVINTASTAGLSPGPNRAAYFTSKAGVIMLTKCLALDWAEACIRVNCVCPGWVDTAMVRAVLDAAPNPAAAERNAAAQHPLGRIGTPRDVAEAMLFLASSRASWVTGSVLVVDGGIVCRSYV